MKTIFQFIKELHLICQFQSIETPNKLASNSEIRRWIDQSSVLINNERCKPDELLDFPIISMVLFPKSDTKKTTIY